MSALSSEFAEARFEELMEEFDGDYWLALAEFDAFDDEYVSGEIWKPVQGCSMYEVSNTGKVRSWRKWKPDSRVPRILKHFISKKGYHCVKLYDDFGNIRNCRIHRLVAEAFVDKEPGRDVVCHKDDNKDNNTADNLYWGTNLTNSVDSWMNGSYYHKSIYCYETDTIYKDAVEAADTLNVCRSAIGMCCRGESSYVNHDFHYHICYVSDMDERLANLEEWIADKRRFPTKTVQATNIYSGEVIIFNSRKEACEKLGIPMYAMSRVLSGDRNHTHGWTFKDLSREVEYA